jgi:hypothetical protein
VARVATRDTAIAEVQLKHPQSYTHRRTTTGGRSGQYRGADHNTCADSDPPPQTAVRPISHPIAYPSVDPIVSTGS